MKCRRNIDEIIHFILSLGIVNRFLSHHWLVVFSRISYAVYLTQFAVFFYNVGTTRFSMEFQIRRAVSNIAKINVLIR